MADLKKEERKFNETYKYTYLNSDKNKNSSIL